jgi:Zn-dependent alcohol dehydrogenase
MQRPAKHSHVISAAQPELLAPDTYGGAGGTATIVGMIPFGQKIEPHGFDFLRERKIQGSSMGSNHFRVDMRLVEFYMRGRLHLEDWISAKLKGRRSTKALPRSSPARHCAA